MSAFLSSRSPAWVKAQLAAFRREYVEDWQAWVDGFDPQQLASTGNAEAFGSVLARWSAVRPDRIRPATALRGRGLVDTLAKIEPCISALEGVTVRALVDPPADTTDAITDLWSHLQDGLGVARRCSEVGVTKAVMLLTSGRIGPALDSQVRAAIGLGRRRITAAPHWLQLMQEIAVDLERFESQQGVKIEALVPRKYGVIPVGRVLDMMLGPKG